MSVDLRLLGDADEVAAVAALLDSVLEGSVLEIAGNGRVHPNRRGFGIRMYFEVRPRPARTGPTPATADRLDRREISAARPARRARGDVR